MLSFFNFCILFGKLMLRMTSFTIAAKVLQLQEVGAYESQNCMSAQNLIRKHNAWIAPFSLSICERYQEKYLVPFFLNFLSYL